MKMDTAEKRIKRNEKRNRMSFGLNMIRSTNRFKANDFLFFI